MKRIPTLAALTLASSVAYAQAPAPAPDWSATANVLIGSEYLFRGIAQTGGKPTLQGGFDLGHTSGFYAGTWASNISWLEDFQLYTYAKLGGLILNQPRGIAYQIFDEKVAGLLEPRYQTGTPVRADSLRALLAQLPVDRARCLQTLEEYNAAVESGPFDPTIRDGLATSASCCRSRTGPSGSTPRPTWPTR